MNTGKRGSEVSCDELMEDREYFCFLSFYPSITLKTVWKQRGNEYNTTPYKNMERDERNVTMYLRRKTIN